MDMPSLVTNRHPGRRIANTVESQGGGIGSLEEDAKDDLEQPSFGGRLLASPVNRSLITHSCSEMHQKIHILTLTKNVFLKQVIYNL